MVADVGDRRAVPSRCGSRWWARRGAPARTLTLASPIDEVVVGDVVEPDVAAQVAEAHREVGRAHEDVEGLPQEHSSGVGP